MKKTLEREIKLQAPPGFSLPSFPGTPIGPRRFTSTYFDTADLRLAGAGITLRRRVEGRRAVWQLKIPRKGARLEIEERGGSLRPPKSFLKVLTAQLRGSELSPVARLRTIRKGTAVHEGDRPVAEVVLDAVQVLNGRSVASRFSEIEIELLEGSEEDLARLASSLGSLGAFPGEERPKLMRALDIQPPPEPSDRRPGSELALIQATIAEQFRQLVGYDPGTRLGEDPEDLHQQRVCIRRLRSLLGSARMLEPEWAGSLRAELEWIGDLMNPVRDLDVMIPYFRGCAKDLPPGDVTLVEPFLDRLQAEREGARHRMLEGLESDRYLALLHALEAATVSLVVCPAEDDLAAGAARRFRKLRKAVAALPDPLEDEALHRVRRLAKKARYTADLVKPSGGKRVSTYLSDLKAIQSILGDFQDAVVAERRIVAYLPHARSESEAFALGRMAEFQAARKRNAIASFPEVWRKAEKSGRSAWR